MTRTKVLYTFKGGSKGNDPNIPNLKTCQLLVDVEKQRDAMIVPLALPLFLLVLSLFLYK